MLSISITKKLRRIHKTFAHLILMRCVAFYARLVNGYGSQQLISVIVKLEVYPEGHYLKSLW
jgi:hypothetical protein